MTARKQIVVLIGSEQLQHRYVAGTLAQLDDVSIVIAQHPRLPLLKRIKRAVKRFGFGIAFSRLLLRLALQASGELSRRRADLRRVLGDPKICEYAKVYRTVGVNSAETQSLLRELSPDILCVYGTYIVCDATLSIARLALNLHTGMSPRYRGADCDFWPLHEGEPNWIGATVHRCTSDVDGGSIYKTEAAMLEAEDGIGAVFGRCVVTGSRLYKAVVQDLVSVRELKTIPQDLSAGREYKVAMRGWGAEVRVMRLINHGLVRDYVSRTVARHSGIARV
jgi:folate-dependent phosphoribosylglycinamide formyltransferase PurN